jgi:hypothetical protein
MLLWLLSLAFGLRVTGQAVQRWAPQPFLPPFDAFQGSNLPFGFLLTAQLVILAAMLRAAWGVQRGTLTRSVQAAKVLRWMGGLYMAGSLLRLGIGLGTESAPEWFRAWLPAVFHVVLAGFVLVLASYHSQRPKHFSNDAA